MRARSAGVRREWLYNPRIKPTKSVLTCLGQVFCRKEYAFDQKLLGDG